MDFKNNNDFIILFEKRLSEFTGYPYVILTNSNTSAIMLSLIYTKRFGVISDNTITIPSRTYISIPQIIRGLGFGLELVDTHWVAEYNLIGTNVWDSAVGFRKDMYEPNTVKCLSFQQKKCLNIGQGGAILTDDLNMYSYVKRISHDGRDSSIPLSHEIKESMENIILDSFHVNMRPDDCARGVLILNQIDDHRIREKIGSSSDYPNLGGFNWN